MIFTSLLVVLGGWEKVVVEVCVWRGGMGVGTGGGGGANGSELL